MAKFLEVNQCSFTLLYDAARDMPLESGLLPAAAAIFAPTQLFNAIDVQMKLGTPVPSQRERFGLYWLEDDGRSSQSDARAVTVAGKMLGYLSFNWNSRRTPHPHDAFMSALREVQSPNLAIGPAVLLECLFITSVCRAVVEGKLQTGNWLALLDEMRPVLQPHIDNLLALWMRGPALFAGRYRNQHDLTPASIAVDEALLAEWHELVGHAGIADFLRADRAESGIINLLLGTSNSLRSGSALKELSALATALLPIARWRNNRPGTVVPNRLAQAALQYQAGEN